MPETFPYVIPHMLVNGDKEAMELHMVEGGYDPDLPEADQYQEGDLVEVVGGRVRLSRAAAAIDVPPLFLAGADYDQPFAVSRGDQRSRVVTDVPLNVPHLDDVFVFTYQGGAADGADYVFTDADMDAVMNRERRDLIWNAEEGCYTVRATAGSPSVTLLGIFRGAVDDSNVRVRVRLDRRGAE